MEKNRIFSKVFRNEFSRNVTIKSVKSREDYILFCSELYQESFITLVNHAINSIALPSIWVVATTHLDQFAFVAVTVIMILNVCVCVCVSPNFKTVAVRKVLIILI